MIQDEDRTLASDAWGTWCVAAMESGVDPADVHALSVVRARLLGAAAAATEVLGEQATGEVVAEAMRHVRDITAKPAYSLYWSSQGDGQP